MLLWLPRPLYLAYLWCVYGPEVVRTLRDIERLPSYQGRKQNPHAEGSTPAR